MTDRGFTLLEVLIAAVVLTAGLLLALEGITAGVAASTRSARRATGGDVAADILTLAAADVVAVPSAGAEDRDGSQYTWDLQWDSALGDASQATCRVEWIYRGRTHSTSLSRLMVTPPVVSP